MSDSEEQQQQQQQQEEHHQHQEQGQEQDEAKDLKQQDDDVVIDNPFLDTFSTTTTEGVVTQIPIAEPEVQTEAPPAPAAAALDEDLSALISEVSAPLSAAEVSNEVEPVLTVVPEPFPVLVASPSSSPKLQPNALPPGIRPQMLNPDSKEVKPILFEDIVVKFLSSVVRLDSKNKPYTSYVISIISGTNEEEQWQIEKRYSAFLVLDEKLRKEYPNLVPRIGRPPEKSVFKRLSPAVVDSRKQALQQYLQGIITHVPNWPRLAAFLGTDIKTQQQSKTVRFSGQREGFLSKRGRTFGVWIPRYFVFRGGALKYFRSGRDDGDPSGELSLENASVEPLADNDAEAMRHAFLLINNGVRHVYCAENDADRDEWVKVLSLHIEMMKPVWDELPDKGAPAVPPVFTDDEEFEEPPSQGPVIKEGQLSAKIGMLSSWKPRLCQILEGGSFVFFKTDRNEDKPVVHVSLANATVEALHDAADVKNAFVLTVPKGSSTTRYVLCAASAEERDNWVASLAKHKSADILDSLVSKKSRKGSVFGWNSNKSSSLPKMSTPSSPKKKGSNTTNAVFGKTLQEALDASRLENLPAVVYRCIEFVDANGLKEEGIYRLSGSAADIKELRDKFSSGEDVRLIDTHTDPNVVAGLLKQFLREIADPILTNELRMEFFDTTNIEDKDLRLAKLARLITLLPVANRDLLKTLMAHLNKVKEFEEVNKMSVRNLGIVFSPTLQIPAGVFSLFLIDYDRLFNKTEETAALVGDIIDEFDEFTPGVEEESTNQIVILDGSSDLAQSMTESED